MAAIAGVTRDASVHAAEKISMDFHDFLLRPHTRRLRCGLSGAAYRGRSVCFECGDANWRNSHEIDDCWSSDGGGGDRGTFRLGSRLAYSIAIQFAECGGGGQSTQRPHPHCARGLPLGIRRGQSLAHDREHERCHGDAFRRKRRRNRLSLGLRAWCEGFHHASWTSHRARSRDSLDWRRLHT